MVSKINLKLALKKATGCVVQHDGWPCGTCFFAMSKQLDNADWQTVLLKRGDYSEDDLDNLPSDREARLEKVLKIAQEVTQ